MSDKFALLILGGGPAGFAAANGFRDAGGEGQVAIVTDEYRMPYERPSLTKELLRGEVQESDLPLEDETWLEQQQVSLISGRIVSFDHDDGTVLLAGGRKLYYQSLVLATGAEPVRLAIPGSDHPAVRVLRTVDDLRELQHRLSDGSRVVVIGSGFIGCEIAASLKMRGHSVAMVSDEPAPNAARLGDEAAAVIARWLNDMGVDLRLGEPVARIEHTSGEQLAVCTASARIRGTVVVMAAGIRPRSELAAMAGIECYDGAIPVDSGMHTRVNSIFAAGDVCIAENVGAARELRVEHWDDALHHGEIAGRNAAGGDERWSEVPGFWSQIGNRVLQYAAWGDGFDTAQFERVGDGFAVHYRRAGKLVGVLAYEAEDQYEAGREAIARHQYV